MPPLEPPRRLPTRIPGDRAGRPSKFGLKCSLERLSPREAGHPPAVFGLETPYTATPTGWGEWIPVMPGEAVDGFVVVLADAGDRAPII